jgi:long-chain fatty acid transport protein
VTRRQHPAGENPRRRASAIDDCGNVARMIRARALYPIALLTLVCSVAGAASDAAASPLELFGFGGRSPGMAGAGVASTEGYDAVFLNPGGLGLVKRKRATFGGMYGDFSLSMDGESTGTPSTSALVFGGAVPIPLGGAAKDRVGMGFGFHIPLEAINRARAPYPGTPDFALLESRASVIGIQFAIGVHVKPRLSVGAGINALAVLRGGIAVTTDGSGRFTTQSEQRLLTRFSPIVGARYRWRDDVDLGLVARAPSRSDYEIAVTSDLSDVLPLELPEILIAGTAQYDPLTVAAEAAWHARPALTVTGHLAWARWSGYPLPTRNPTAGTPPQEAASFHDTAIPRLAIEYARPALGGSFSARGGYAFLWSPAPEQTGRQSLLDNHRHVVAAGLGLDWPDRLVPLHLDAWVQLHALQPRRHTKDGAIFPPADPPPFDVLDTGGRIVVGGLTVGVDL